MYIFKFFSIQGNQFFKDNLLNEAINCYTTAIELEPTNYVYPGNRAMCLIKQEKFENDPRPNL